MLPGLAIAHMRICFVEFGQNFGPFEKSMDFWEGK